MDEAWERAVEAARAGEPPVDVRSLTLDGALKCSQGRLPSASLLEQFVLLRVLSVANVGLTSLADFPSLPYLERLVLSDNRIAGGLEHLVKARLLSLRDLDLSNNKIQQVEDLSPLADLNLVCLDLYKCSVTRLPHYRVKVFHMIKSLEYLDKLDVENNERPESDDEEDEDDLEDEIEPEGGYVYRGKFDVQPAVTSSGREDDDDVEEDDDNEDEDEESDELDEEDGDAARYNKVGQPNQIHCSNKDSGSDEEEVDDDDGQNTVVQDIEESEEEDEEDNGEEGTEQGTEGEIDDQENEDDGEDENGELGEEDAEEADDYGDDEDEEEEDYGTEYLVRALGRAEDEEAESDFEPGEEDEDDDDDIEDEDDEEPAPLLKRKRDKDEGDGSNRDEKLPKH
eukprot:c25486_g2_i1 orf=323-1513(+)